MRSAARALIGALAAVTIATLSGCAGVAPHTAADARPARHEYSTTTSASASTAAAALTASRHPQRVEIVGDSLTAGGARMLSQGLDANTWMTYAQGHGVDFVGGWAKGGTTVQIMAANVKPLPNIDVLVLMAGTNDVRLHIPFAQAQASYQHIVDVVHPRHVIIGALPPYNRNPEGAALYQRQLAQYVHSKGWNLVDPWGFARQGLIYAHGTTVDGIHPTTAGYRKVGLAFRAAILSYEPKAVAG